MRASIALACFVSAMIAGVTVAQCPTVHRNHYSVVPVQSSCGSNYAFTKPCVSYPVAQGCQATQSCQVAPNCQVVQSCHVAQNITNSPTQYWSVVPQPAITFQPAFAQQVTQGTAQNNCNCQSASASPQANPQAASILDNPRNPFSLAGHARPGTDQPAVFHCQQEFLRCCENGGLNCMSNYINCTQITGEPLRHSACPAATPTIDEKAPNKPLQKT